MNAVLTAAEKENIYIASGFAHPELAGKIALELAVDLGPVHSKMHPNSEVYSRYSESVRGKHVFIVQPHINGEIGGRPTNVNDAIMQLNLMADAARSSSAGEITAVIPYLGYSRQDRKSKGREPIGTRVVVDQHTGAGVDRFVTVDMHSPQTQAIFRGPFDHLTAQPDLRKAMRDEIKDFDPADCVVVAPDAGAAKSADRHSQEMGMGMLIMSKIRNPEDSQKIRREDKIAGVEGRVCMIFDDMIDTAGTLISAAEALKNSGARAVFAAGTHAVFSNDAAAKLRDSPIDRVLVTDTFRTAEAQAIMGDKLRVVSVAPMIGQAIIQIIQDGSVSEIFNDQNHM